MGRMSWVLYIFFFQAEDGIRDIGVTGVQTCALPILAPESARAAIREVFLTHVIGGDRLSHDPRLRQWVRAVTPDAVLDGVARSEERRVGKECRSRWWPYH